MVMLFCAIVGVAGSAFSVRVDESDSVDDLKEKIKGEKPNDFKEVDADKLQLFLAKTEKGAGAWLTEKDVMEGVSDTSDLKLLGAARVRLRRVGLSDREVGGVDEAEPAEGRGPVNVLVVVQSHVRVDIGETGFRALKYNVRILTLLGYAVANFSSERGIDDGSSTYNASYLSFWRSLQSLFWPLEKTQQTKKDI
ncbi:Crinkler (CRN) family protein [Phytophthora infestans T30-4]|uniref:Crinkler (CRN) family protein n=1 Tax=Phytophthora infestans (strain T30-4) TaxID=403677 RepID=D0NSL1_PHYIT|nr:Crinkler (CRN) family protein [Phytophthora infestans T30-4]EEY64573.1 Crinkler (CRN) family protein [Phytophthora infestans T30-4]|eukprot:XP_002897773.1 Crinkler (CRN) family protein [Phytophthora infestans T30-4]